MAVAVFASACGDRSALLGGSARPFQDATSDAAVHDGGMDASLATSSDAGIEGGIPCGAMECVPGAVCVTTLTGAGPCGLFPTDAGLCPASMGERGGCCYPATRECLPWPSGCDTGTTCECPALHCAGICACYDGLSPEFLCDCTET